MHTGKGTNTATDRYWGLGSYVWNNDKDAAWLRNSPSGTLIDYCVQQPPRELDLLLMQAPRRHEVVQGMTHGDDEHAQACAWLEEYLDVMGVEYEYEPDLGTQKKPDYRVTTPSGSVVCEVKAFSPWPMPADGFYVRDMRQVLATSRNSIRTAARQLSELAGQGIPLVVVLANPAEAHVSLDQVVQAVYGDMQEVITAHGDGSTSTELQATRNGRLPNDHPYVSGVLVLRRGSQQQDDLHDWQPSRDDLTSEEFTAELNTYVKSITADGLDTYLEATYIEAPGREATPLPEGVFVGKHAYRWRLNASGTAIVRGPA